MGAQTKERADLDAGEIHDILRNDRRRLAIKCLREQDGPLSVRDLSEEVATRETGESPAPRDKRRSVYVSLHQTHLPKLDELGIVSYDTDSKEVRLRDRAAEITTYMEVVPRYGITWAEYYLVLGILGFGTVLAASIGTPLLGAIGTPAVAAGYLLILTGSAAFHVRSQDRDLFEGLRA
jgi:predicted transcriptional regulator